MKFLTFKAQNLFLTLIFFIGINQGACSNPTDSIVNFLNQKEIQYEQIAFELGDAYWNFYSAEKVADLKTPKKKFYDLLNNDSLNFMIDTWYIKRSEIKDTILKKRIEKWHRVLLSAKVEYSSEIMELRNELEEMLQVSNDNDNSNYDFEASMLKLIELRNKKSVELGYDNYVHLTFETNGIGYEWFKKFIHDMDFGTTEAYKALVEKAKKESKIEKIEQKNVFQFYRQFHANNDATDLKIKNNIELVTKSLENIGIDYNNLPAKLVEMELPAGIGGQGLMINIPGDFRAVMTLGMDISVWMHEMGHGLHGLYNTINHPILEGYEWVPGNANPSFAEGMAETSAYFTRDMEWQKKYTNLTEPQIIERKSIVNEYAPAFIRFHLYNFMCETELYMHPEKSYADIQIELSKKYLMIESDEIRTRGIENIIYVSYPLYLQNYLIADMVATQIHKALKEKFGKEYAFNPEVEKFLSEKFYQAGEYYDWNERLIQGTGKPLDIEAYFTYYNLK